MTSNLTSSPSTASQKLSATTNSNNNNLLTDVSPLSLNRKLLLQQLNNNSNNNNNNNTNQSNNSVTMDPNNLDIKPVLPVPNSSLSDDLIGKKRKHTEIETNGNKGSIKTADSAMNTLMEIAQQSSSATPETRSLTSSTSTSSRTIVTPVANRLKPQSLSTTPPSVTVQYSNSNSSFHPPDQPTPSPISSRLAADLSSSSASSSIDDSTPTEDLNNTKMNNTENNTENNAPVNNCNLDPNIQQNTNNNNNNFRNTSLNNTDENVNEEDQLPTSRLLRHINKKPFRVWTYKVQRLQVPGTQLSSMENGLPNDIISVPIRVMGNINELYFVAADLSQLIHSRKSNIAKAVSAFSDHEKARMPILCPRSNGTVSTHVLTVLSLAGVKRLLQASRAAIALPILKWILDKIQELKVNPHADEDSTNLNQQQNIDRAKIYNANNKNLRQKTQNLQFASRSAGNATNLLASRIGSNLIHSAPSSTTTLNTHALQTLIANGALNGTTLSNILLNNLTGNSSSTANNNTNWLSLLTPSAQLNNFNNLNLTNFAASNTANPTANPNNNNHSSTNFDTTSSTLLQQLQHLQQLQSFNSNPTPSNILQQMNNFSSFGLNQNTSPLTNIHSLNRQFKTEHHSPQLANLNLPFNFNSTGSNPNTNNSTANPTPPLTPLQLLNIQRVSQQLLNSANNAQLNNN